MKRMKSILKVALVGVAIAAVAAVVLYVTFVNPDWQPAVDKSIALTHACVREAPNLERDEDGEAGLASATGWGDFTIMTSGKSRAVLVYATSDRQAESGERELRELVRSSILGGLKAAGLPEGDVDLQKLAVLVNESVVHRGFQVIAYFSGDPNALIPPRRARMMFNKCVWAVREPKWAFLDLLDQQNIDRPFVDSRVRRGAVG